MAPRPRILSLCSGIDGIGLGVGRVFPAARTVCHVEIEAYAAAVLASRMAEGRLDHAPIWSDMRTFDARRWRGAVDLITAGFPCQPFSVAGKQRGSQDPRHLWPIVRRIINGARPGAVLLENVSGLLTVRQPDGRTAYEVVRSERESGSSFSARPTARAEDSESCGNHPGAIDLLTGATAQWRTPSAMEPGVNAERLKGQLGTRLYDETTGRNCQYGLTQQVQMAQSNWTTPQNHDANGGDPSRVRRFGTKHVGANLADDVTAWPTATSGDHKASGSAAYPKTDMHTPGVTLTDAIKMWPTPQASDNQRDSQSDQAMAKWAAREKASNELSVAARFSLESGGGDIQAATQAWRSPTSRDWKGESAASWQTRTDGDTTPTLADQVSQCGLPDPTTEPDGPQSSPSGQTSRRRLNSQFVEWLQGYPIGWTLAEPIASAPSETPSFQRKPSLP